MPPGQVRYADSDGVAIAYAVYGDGPVNVVMFPGLFAHLELNEELPYYRPFLERVPEFGRLVMFDRRGLGLSDRSRFGTAEERMDDLRAVMDALDLERAAIIGTADGAALAVLFAATYPDRVSSLVLHESVLGPGWGNAVSDDALDALSTAWGTGMFLGMLFEGCLPNDDNQAKVARWERNIAWPTQFRQLMAQSARTDVRSALPLITAPTLLVHNIGDAVTPVDSARMAAAAIPGARLVEVPFDCHCSWDGKTIHAA
ncbi:MAG: alpha/beta hydrolase, partial [Acidimicrobiia bacterium]|nr:alpha/beta hydrolase [Acidimicrobiia bacterium]